MNEVFRLYVAAYQHRPVWKEVWKLVKPILSTQIIKDVEAFTNIHPMDCYSTVSVILYGTSVPPDGVMMMGKPVVTVAAASAGAPASSQPPSLNRRDSAAWSECSLTPSASASVCAPTYNNSDCHSATAFAATKALELQRRKNPRRYAARGAVVAVQQPVILAAPPAPIDAAAVRSKCSAPATSHDASEDDDVDEVLLPPAPITCREPVSPSSSSSSEEDRLNAPPLPELSALAADSDPVGDPAGLDTADGNSSADGHDDNDNPVNGQRICEPGVSPRRSGQPEPLEIILFSVGLPPIARLSASACRHHARSRWFIATKYMSPLSLDVPPHAVAVR